MQVDCVLFLFIIFLSFLSEGLSIVVDGRPHPHPTIQGVCSKNTLARALTLCEVRWVQALLFFPLVWRKSSDFGVCVVCG